MLDAVKQRLRISHAKLDPDILRTIETAKAELIRLGVLALKANDANDPLIMEAIVTYCQREFTDDDKKYEMYTKSWETQVDGLRKSKGYKNV